MVCIFHPKSIFPCTAVLCLYKFCTYFVLCSAVAHAQSGCKKSVNIHFYVLIQMHQLNLGITEKSTFNHSLPELKYPVNVRKILKLDFKNKVEIMKILLRADGQLLKHFNLD